MRYNYMRWILRACNYRINTSVHRTTPLLINGRLLEVLCKGGGRGRRLMIDRSLGGGGLTHHILDKILGCLKNNILFE